MFASHAAMAVANARRYREERRARADLETLVNTSPVGVVVFDAPTGTPAYLNREARRIVGGLLNRGQEPADLLAQWSAAGRHDLLTDIHLEEGEIDLALRSARQKQPRFPHEGSS